MTWPAGSRSTDKWETIEQLIARMPGGRMIGDAWKAEPLVEVFVHHDDDDIDEDEDYSFRTNVLIAAIREYGEEEAVAALPDYGGDEADLEGSYVMNVHPIVAEMLAFWSDGESTYWLE